MFAALYKFFWDIDTFKSWSGVIWITIKGVILSLAVGIGSGQIKWPEGLPWSKWIVPGLTFLSVLIQIGEKNMSAAGVKLLVKEADNQSTAQVVAEARSEKIPEKTIAAAVSPTALAQVEPVANHPLNHVVERSEDLKT